MHSARDKLKVKDGRQQARTAELGVEAELTLADAWRGSDSGVAH